MKAKVLVVTAMLCVASVASALAQVYSVNAVGYVNVVVPAGKFALLNNPLTNTANDVKTLFADAPNGTKVFVFQDGAFVEARKINATTWSGAGATATLMPGQGFFVQNNGAADFTVTFVGEVFQGTFNIPLAAGFNLIGSPVPQEGKVKTDLSLPAKKDDRVHKWLGDAYESKRLVVEASNVWSPAGEPVVKVAEGFWYEAVAAGSWTREFHVQ